jgi:hypothetical protein
MPRKYDAPKNLPDMRTDQAWTADLGNLVQRNQELLMLARLMRDPAGQEHLRTLWQQIDQSVDASIKYAQFEPSGQLKRDRLFAGISQDGGRYVEVYEKENEPGKFGVFSGYTTHRDNGLQLTEGMQLTEPGPDGDFWISFDDPASDTPDQPAALHLRRLDDGTSSYLAQAGENASYEGEYLPIGYMQDIVRFDHANIRGSLMDGQGVPHGMLIDMSPPPIESQTS